MDRAHRYLVWAVALLVGCGPVFFASRKLQVEYVSSMRVAVNCKDAGWRFASGVAIGPNRVLTAKHVVGGCEVVEAWVVPFLNPLDADDKIPSLKDRGIRARVLKVSPKGDAMVLGLSRNVQWYSAVSFAPVKTGDRVCFVGGDKYPQTGGYRKCGHVGYVGNERYYVSMSAVPGNSGGPFYDETGDVVGVVSRGAASNEFDGETIAQATATLRDLLQ